LTARQKLAFERDGDKKIVVPRLAGQGFFFVNAPSEDHERSE